MIRALPEDESNFINRKISAPQRSEKITQESIQRIFIYLNLVKVRLDARYFKNNICSQHRGFIINKIGHRLYRRDRQNKRYIKIITFYPAFDKSSNSQPRIEIWFVCNLHCCLTNGRMDEQYSFLNHWGPRLIDAVKVTNRDL